MITAVDTNVLFDVFIADPHFGERSKRAVRACLSEGRLIACEAVWAEVCAAFPSPNAAEQAMARLEVGFSGTTRLAALRAGAAWKTYRKEGGGSKRVIADFLIGAHASAEADRLLTRDRGFYRSYFRRLTIVDPTH